MPNLHCALLPQLGSYSIHHPVCDLTLTCVRPRSALSHRTASWGWLWPRCDLTLTCVRPRSASSPPDCFMRVTVTPVWPHTHLCALQVCLVPPRLLHEGDCDPGLTSHLPVCAPQVCLVPPPPPDCFMRVTVTPVWPHTDLCAPQVCLVPLAPGLLHEGDCDPGVTSHSPVCAPGLPRPPGLLHEGDCDPGVTSHWPVCAPGLPRPPPPGLLHEGDCDPGVTSHWPVCAPGLPRPPRTASWGWLWPLCDLTLTCVRPRSAPSPHRTASWGWLWPRSDLTLTCVRPRSASSPQTASWGWLWPRCDLTLTCVRPRSASSPHPPGLLHEGDCDPGVTSHWPVCAPGLPRPPGLLHEGDCDPRVTSHWPVCAPGLPRPPLTASWGWLWPRCDLTLTCVRPRSASSPGLLREGDCDPCVTSHWPVCAPGLPHPPRTASWGWLWPRCDLTLTCVRPRSASSPPDCFMRVTVTTGVTSHWPVCAPGLPRPPGPRTASWGWLWPRCDLTLTCVRPRSASSPPDCFMRVTVTPVWPHTDLCAPQVCLVPLAPGLLHEGDCDPGVTSHWPVCAPGLPHPPGPRTASWGWLWPRCDLTLTCVRPRSASSPWPPDCFMRVPSLWVTVWQTDSTLSAGMARFKASDTGYCNDPTTPSPHRSINGNTRF